MSTSYHPYSDISSSRHPSPDNTFSPILAGYRNGLVHRGQCPDQNTELLSPNMTLMDDASNDYHHHQQIANTNNSHKMCAGCGDKISDRFLLHALDRFWHNACLKCHCCGTRLADVGTSCFTRRGLILCKKDYSSMFGCSGICSGCGETIPPHEMVAKAVPAINQQQQANKSMDNQKNKQPLICVFHLKCFTCTKCGANLQPGDRYAMLGANLVCEQDWQKLLKNATMTNGPVPSMRKGKVGRPRRNKD